MNKTDLKDLLFEKFQQQCEELVGDRNNFQAKVNEFQRKLDDRTQKLRDAYGPEILNGLGSFSLVSTASVIPSEGVAETKEPQKRKPTRTTRPGSMAHEFSLHIPAAIATLTANQGEFRVGQLYELIKGNVKCTLQYLTSFLSQNPKMFGLVIEKKKVEGAISAVNYYRLKKSKTASSPERIKPIKAERWAEIFQTALGGEKLKFGQFWTRVKALQPMTKYAFKTALARARDKGKLSLKDGIYEWVATPVLSPGEPSA